MKLSEKTLALLALWLISGMGPRRIYKLVEHFGQVEKVFDTSPSNLSKILGVDIKITEKISSALESGTLANELRLLEKHQIEVIDYTQESYPRLLKEIYNAPPILYQKGNIDFNSGLYIAFVGSRKASFAGKSICKKLIAKLAELYPETVIVSGLALGIDSAAHTAALDCGLKTVSVLAGGLSDIYPTQNQKLSEKIQHNGALITEFPAGTRPVAGNFPLRNRIISGISKGVVIVEAGERSGASITAGYALEQNRELFALPGPADSRFHLGTNRLIQKGSAKLVIKADDILEEVLPSYLNDRQTVQLEIPADQSELTSVEKAVLKLLEDGNAHQDMLAKGLNMPVYKLLATLTTLEVKGLIVSKPGAVYEAVVK